MSAKTISGFNNLPDFPDANEGRADTAVYRVLIIGDEPRCVAMAKTPGTAYGAYYAAISEWPDVPLVLQLGTRVLARSHLPH